MHERAVSASPYAAAIRQWLGRPVWLTVAASLVLVAAYGSAVVAALWGPLPLFAAALVTFVCAHAGFSVAHEASHRAISGGARGLGWLDTMLGHAHCWMLLYDFAAFRTLHLRHHANTNLPANDPDYWLQTHGTLDVIWRSWFIPFHYLNLYARLAVRGEVPRREAIRCFVGIAALMTAFVSALVIAPIEAFVLWIVPASAASSLINLSHRMLHLAEISRDHRRTTRIVVGDRVWEWLMCPFFWLNNHHLIHHESPRLPAIAHKAVYAALEPDLVASGVEIVRLGRQARGRNG